MKKKIAMLLVLALCVCTLAGCVSTEGLKKVPQGERPETLDMETLEPKFPSDSAVKNQLMLIATDMKTAPDIDTQREKYNEFLYNAYVYVVGPYNFASYLSADGRSISVYYDNMVNHMNTFLSEWDPTAWTAISDSSWGAQLKAEYSKLMCTPDSIRNAYPTSDETVSALLQTMYDARDALAEGLASEEGSDLETLMDDVFTSREAVADAMNYDSYLDFVVEKREKMPYNLENLLKLAQLVKENLAPAVAAAQDAELAQLTAEQWEEALPALARRFPEYSEDLLYVLENGVYAVEDSEDGTSKHFAYQFYQYDVSAGKAVLAGEAEDALHVLRGLGLEARNMALPQNEWSMSALTVYDSVQENAFLGCAIGEIDAIYSEKADAARQCLITMLAQDVCKSAMELELMSALYENPVMAQGEREALAERLAAEYGFAGMDLEQILSESEDVIMGTLNCAGDMLGGLYGLTLYDLSVQDAAAADAVLSATLCVYNAGNPIVSGYAAGLSNPYSTEGIQNVARLIK